MFASCLEHAASYAVFARVERSAHGYVLRGRVFRWWVTPRTIGATPIYTKSDLPRGD